MGGALEGGFFRMGENGGFSRVGKGVDFFLKGGRVGKGVDFSTGRGGLFPRPPFSQSVVCFHFVLFQSSIIDDTD